MKYIALLRGINISGKNKILMSELKLEIENNKYQNVYTYLNSGNVIFESDIDNKNSIMKDFYRIIKNKFNLEIPIFIMTAFELEDILNNNPKWWGTNNKKIYDNLIFIIPPTRFEEIYNTIGKPKENVEKIEEYNNSIFWSYDLKNYRKSNWWNKTASTNISDKITIRTANTMKKVLNSNLKVRYKMENIKREELEKLVGIDKVNTFYNIVNEITKLYDMEQVWNNGGKKWTYEYKFRKSGKTLCAFYFKDNTLGFMIIFGKDERIKLEEIRNELSSDVLETYDNAQTYHDGKWVMFDITDNSILEDLKKLLLI